MRKALWTVLPLASCATGGVHPLRPLDLPTASYLEGAAIERVAGSLTYDDNCLMFRARGGDRLLPVWPVGTVFNGTSLMFHRPGKTDHPLLVNEEIQISGEHLPAGYVRSHFQDYLQRCGGTPFFVAKVRPAD